MPEREIIVDHLRLSYEGLFSVPELYKLIDQWFREKGYDKNEKKNVESIFPEGKRLELVMEPWKKYTDYIRLVMRLRIIMEGVKEVEVEKDGMKVRLNQGKVQIVFDGYFETDYEFQWEQKPFFFFFRTIIDRYVMKGNTDMYRGQCVQDVNALHTLIKSYLNLYRY